jgi:predicted nucleic acid-binding protein
VLAAWDSLERQNAALVTTNYVVLEVCAVAQTRRGLGPVRGFVEKVLPIIEVEWVDRLQHQAAVAQLLSSHRRKVSLVDWVSFATMKRLGVQQALAVDPHFREQGFECLPTGHFKTRALTSSSLVTPPWRVLK